MPGTLAAAVTEGRKRGTVSLRCYITTDASGDMSAVTLPSAFGRLVGLSYSVIPRHLAQVSTITMNASGGTFTITRSAATTAAIAWNASAAEVKAAMDAATTSVKVKVTKTGSDGSQVYTLTFDDPASTTLGHGSYSAVTTSAASLIAGNGSAAAATVADVVGSAALAALATGADITIKDANTSATLMVITNAGTTDLHYTPVTSGSDPTIGPPVVTSAGVVITADTSNNDLNRDIYVGGPLTVTVAQGGNVCHGALTLIVEEC